MAVARASFAELIVRRPGGGGKTRDGEGVKLGIRRGKGGDFGMGVEGDGETRKKIHNTRRCT